MSDSGEAPREFIDLDVPGYIEEALRRREGRLSTSGSLHVSTGRRRDRSAADRFIVREPSVEDDIDWGVVNRPFDAEDFDLLWDRVEVYLGERDHFVAHLHVGDNEDHYLPLEIRAELAWHGLVARTLLITPKNWNPDRKPHWRILSAANFVCDPQRDGTASDATVIIHFAQRRILLAGMHYAGELRSAIYAMLNLLFPEKDVLPMHCAASVDSDGSTALFFGASGSGKTALATDPRRPFLGDAALGWSRDGVFALESGCYVRKRDLQTPYTPPLDAAIRFGAVAENCADDNSPLSDDTPGAAADSGRCCFPRDFLPHSATTTSGIAARHLFFLCCDRSGVLPALSLLSPDAAVFHFLAGYQSTLRPVSSGAAPFQSHFSACFSSPHLPRPAYDYAELLARRMQAADSEVYLINTGHLGPDTEEHGHGAVRIPLSVTRRIVDAALAGSLRDITRLSLPTLNLKIPSAVEGVDSALLDPRNHWPDATSYETAARTLARQLREAVQRFDPPSAILAAGPAPDATPS